MTLRENTERPITVSIGTNRLVSFERLEGAVLDLLDAKAPRRRVPEL